MSINLVELAKQAITGQVMDQLSGMVGSNRQSTESAVGASIPAILGGLLGKASSPKGSEEVLGSLKDFDGGLLDNLGGLVGGDDQDSLIEKGIKLLTMLFGSKQSSLVGSIAKMAGVDDSKAGSLLGILAPIVMSILSKQSPASGFSAGGLTDLMMSQKNNIASAMPQGLASQLGIGDLLGQGSDAVAGAANTAHTAAREVESAGGGLMKFLIPLGILAVLGFAAWSFLGSGGADAMKDGAKSINNQAGGVADDLSSVELGPVKDEISSMLGGLTESISGIKDAESAKEAVSGINDATTSWNNLKIGSMKGSVVSGLGQFISPLLDKLEAALETAYEIPGVGDIIEPVLGPLLSKMEEIAR